ncbi:hypothetical protein [Rhodococcus sp. H29-C3]|uniref:hypothetical protein n=1 Tax=Rhodococcus sp. H29-C3 TaxID=3046307 RepID=UPI0024B97D3A|nr:hypothetical protein [Rhodococcus sp. H29-C3]MDJ0359647.1 hypothetical protein [Rhodococcus sp. H29-C3]
MELQRRLIADLFLLTEALDSDTVDLAHLALRLVSDIDDAVSSVVSVSLIITIDGGQFEVAASTEDGNACGAASSLRITLPGLPKTSAVAQLVILSGTAGAFVNLAADVTYSLGLAGAAIVLDDRIRHTDKSELTATVVQRTLSAVSVINQAVGVLIESGRTPCEGRAELHRLALQSGSPAIEIARRILRDALGWHPPRC